MSRRVDEAGRRLEILTVHPLLQRRQLHLSPGLRLCMPLFRGGVFDLVSRRRDAEETAGDLAGKSLTLPVAGELESDVRPRV
jgi:hypothetical protein